MKNGNRKKRIGILLAAVLLLCAGCAPVEIERPAAEAAPETAAETGMPAGEAEIGVSPEDRIEDILILYTNDTHGAFDTNLGFAKVAELKKQCLKTNRNVTLVDCGDHTQGGALGAVSKGKYLIGIMNKAGYDFATLGNHEFDFGPETLRSNMMEAEFRYLCCNVSYCGKGTDPLFGLEPYEIVDYGGTKVAFVGVTTPSTLTSAGRINLSENGVPAFDFSGKTQEELNRTVQDTVDACRSAGADKVILLSHLGDAEEQFTSTELIAGTSGIDAVLDGHSHSEIVQRTVNNKDGEPVLLSSAGTEIRKIGKLVLHADGTMDTSLIGSVSGEDAETGEYIGKIREGYEEELRMVLGTVEFDLQTEDADGVRMIRARETNLGDLCADALRAYPGAQIGLQNSGAIRETVPAGEITRGDVLNTFPFMNRSVMIRTSGEHILEALEMGARNTETVYKDSDGNRLGESGGFFQVSGLCFTVDTSVPSGVILNENGEFLKLEGTRRVVDVQVENEDGTRTDLDPEQDYTVVVSAYIVSGGDGMTMFLNDEILADGIGDSEALARFIRYDLEGTVPERYQKPGDRIRIR